ncbi:MAG: hypothetical protein A2821_03960 [Candidatus Magasanikbacteria bacterium RIFCSPHIGHO2_01_FULL_41_23]|uniref:Major facilitator superfamily (MFS) profile domain-containing protein n=1 Tax=Candidatus Magasanikbacteria bacterium RIFCSPLOWO2_01_FULL_40_15 TaxID=1798686 RepID=A0A1F6N2Z7_9BACT|nr:MAG: hypothetical protein A2821_03960 [Candidatus Magasanikbacteria bacterium RIFCSPHIGHO2_01_FULL_41_23]OGH66971.1 MAG: hypothetical protein A3C66_00500 [Candidatus Magasanikbacteria bacterium RIFCSPHIGHO2_02_FULL_41_35]OGH74952.1 MAG: hypothetical protein A3F22_02635 [Candidatus Magasanikbacteria bacterium RIFCSPHIGHO2_12_FULL_41_16]OGH78254.1 MAG: hypothetical protein A2983_02270 [Candidatus Magasanikbacteria bacterium RIFCSPLOWO2_01_FULL_40_15]
MALATLLCWLSWILVLINIDPFVANLFGLGFFYVSFFFSLIGTTALGLFFMYQHRWQNKAPLFAYVAKSFREAIFVSGFLTLAIFLQGEQWLNWWTGSLLAAGFILFLSLIMSLAPRHEARSDYSPNNFV